MACSEVRAWAELSVMGRERYSGVGGTVSSVEAAENGDDLGLSPEEELEVSSSTLGIHICRPVRVRMKWPRS